MENTTYGRLIKAAIEVMNDMGYQGMSIGILANMVGISKSTVIHYFKSKEGILLAVLENFLPHYIEEFKPVLTNKNIDGIEKMHQFIHFHMKMVAEQKDVLSINLRDTKYLSGKYRTIYQNQQRAYEEQVVSITKQIQTEKHPMFQDLNPIVVAKAIIGMCNHACFWYKENDLYTMDELAEQFIAIVTGDNDTFPVAHV